MPELDLGNVKGPQGKSAYQSALDAGYSGSEEAFNTAMAKAPDAVLYTAQTLTDEQKAQARGNINAAPGGFGLGELTGRTANGFSDITGYGFFRIPTESGFAPDTSTNWGGVYIGASLSYGTLLYARNNALMAVREVSGGEVGPIEWVNPPMQLGIEYRTTERYLGKPLYKKLIEFPSLTGRDYVQVHGRSGFVISAIGEVRSPQDTNFWMPMVVNPIAGQANTPFPTISFTNVYSADVGVVCASTSEHIGQPARVLVTYYKTTD